MTLLAVVGAAALAGLSCIARAADAPLPDRAFQVVYRAGGSVYLDGGAADGLRLGDTLVVKHLGSEIALVRVSDLSSRRAACDTLLMRRAIDLGDRARVIGRGPQPETAAADVPDAEAADSSAAAPASTRTPRARPWLRGRAGARWVSASSEGGVSFQQPMLDLHADVGSDETPFAGGIDVRGRRTTRTSAAGTSDERTEARVYRATLTWQQPGAPARLSAGRLTSPSLASVSTFDGGLAEVGRGRWRLGAFGGTQPEPVHMGWSGRVSEYGGFLEARTTGFPSRRWQAGVGAVSSYDGTHPSRDFLFAQGFYRDRRFSGSWLQEADVMRPVRRQPGEPGFSPTSTFLSARAELVPAFAVVGGFDNRRNVRLWRDRVTPETEFDDRYRQGVWTGGVLRARKLITISADRRWNRTGGEPTSVTSAGLDLRAPRWRMLGLNGRWSQFASTELTNRLFAGSIGIEPWPAAHVEVSAGHRVSTNAAGVRDPAVRWWGAGADLTLGRRWFLDVSWEATEGQLERGTQVVAGLSRRL